ncbi:hypothetical protein QG516_26300 [Pedobacter gandavensis]|uniref:hypothetical protein n=1 Tax=Pedobacter gandavensis TaxID=2679963 RepID=UPI002479FC2F|nr:hypothetical protein [Pedobacter gandavensis]WGQ10028.1 hypothetical protein QG516_26300 [Pedobacter gandavensis]
MNSTSNRSLSFLLLLLTSLFGCTDGELTAKNEGAHKYSIYILAKDGSEYIVETDQLDAGVILPEKEGAELNTKEMDRSVIVKNGYYYHLNRKKAALVKYELKDKQLREVQSMPLAKFSIENFHWLGRDTLLLTGLNTPEFTQVKYNMLNVAAMKPISEGNMEIPVPSGNFDNMSVGFVKKQGSKLLVGYTYHQELGLLNYTTSDTTYVTELNYPQMTAVKTAKDTRSTYPGGVNTVQTSSFEDAEGDFYFMDCPGIALGNRPELATGILRINKNETSPDPHYFFNISRSIGNHAYGMWPVGGNKAIVRAERKDLFKGLWDHYSTPHFEFYLVDVKNNKVINKLALPLDKGTRRECVLLKDNIAYISINSSAEGNFIWKYDLKTGALSKGLELAGNTDFILRIDQLR